MATAHIAYLGQLRTHSTHSASGQEIITDAPLDNHGRGEAFSPTDLVCSALGSCMLTIMGILAERENIDLGKTTIEVTKHMQQQPRKISKIEVTIRFNNPHLDDIQKTKLERAAHTCPVALSLHPDIAQEILFVY